MVIVQRLHFRLMELPQEGDRIELLVMPHDPAPQERGAQGTVRKVTELTFAKTTQICVDWDNGRTINLCCPPDRYRIINRAGLE